MATLVIQKASDADRLKGAKTLFSGAQVWLLMVPFIFFATTGNFSFQQTQGNGTSLSGLSYTGRNIGFVGYVVIPGIAYAIVMLCLARNGRAVAQLALRTWLVSLLALLTVFSAMWSQEPARSLTFGLLYAIDTCFGFYLVARFDPEELKKIVMLAGTALAILSIGMVLFFPQFGKSESVRDGVFWIGIFNARTSCAKYLTFFVSPAIGFGARSIGFRRVAYVLLLTLLIVKSHAVTALFVLFVYALASAAFYLFRKFDTKSGILIGGFALVSALVVLVVGLPFLPSLFASFGRDPTISGRTVVWDAVMQSILKHPFLGYGFYAFWLGLKGESANIIVATHWVFGYAHNGVLEIILQLGLVGGAVFLLSFLQAIRNAWLCLRRGKLAGIDWYVAILFLTFLYNFDEATVVWPNDLLSIFYIVACCGLAKAAAELGETRKWGAWRA